ncbi:hypothetical protein HEN96_023695, partial [Escherichia coli]|nr:hypothetical protein [Escherichia coli]
RGSNVNVSRVVNNATHVALTDSDIVTRICRVSGMEGGILLLHMAQE